MTPEPGRMATATVLFCDVVGSTAQRTTLGDDAADRLAVILDRTLRGTVAQCNGTVVKSTGDGIMAVFDAASDALGAAVDLQQRMEVRNRTAAETERILLRIGLSAGDVQFVAHDCHGTPVVEAARLEAAAEAGSIFVSALVRLLAGSRGGFRFEPVGLLELKGLPEPVDTARVLWEPREEPVVASAEAEDGDEDSEIPLPARVAVRPVAGMIGYVAERAEIDDAWKRVGRGDGPEIVLISGEAGLGKTTLAVEAARAMFDDGACVLFGHCEEDLATPYQLFAEALGHYVAHASVDRLRAHVAAYGSELVRVVPGLAGRIPDLPPSRATDSDTERFLLFAAAVGLLAAIGEEQPVVLLLDDLQWADRASLLMLGHLASTAGARRILVIGTFRDSELSYSHALRAALGDLHRHARVDRVELAGLDDSGVVALMQAIAGYDLVADEISLAHAVYRETDGNPFFVTEVLRHLVETGALFQNDEGRWVADGAMDRLALPDSVREVIGGRVVRLGGRAEHVLSLAAVIGRDFDLELLTRAAVSTEDEVLDILDAAIAAALVRENADTPGHYSFAHALVQHTVYADLGTTRRARMHRLVAEALEEMSLDRPDARVGELARHWTSATTPSDVSKAVEYSRRAGDAALAGLAPNDAHRYYTEALDLLDRSVDDDPVLALDLMIGLGTAQRQLGDPAFHDTLIDAARRAIALDDTPRLVAAVLANDRGFFRAFGQIDDDKVEVIEAALARVSGDDPTRAPILALYCLEVAVGRPLEVRASLAEEALRIAEASGDDAVVVRVLNNTAYPMFVAPLLAESLARSETALAYAARVGDPVQSFFASHWRCQIVAQVGDIEEMDRQIETVAEMADRLRQPMLTWVYRFHRAWRSIIAGDPDRAEALALEAFEAGTAGSQPDAEFIFGAQMMMVQHQRGALDAVRSVIEQMAATTPSVARILSGALAIADLEAGREDEARQRLESFVADGCRLEMNPIWLTGLCFHADPAIDLGDPELAAPLIELLEPYADQWTNTGATTESPVCHFLGGLLAVCGRFDEAEPHFLRATDMCERLDAKFFRALNDLRYGRMLMLRGSGDDAARARVRLEAAEDAGRTYGYGMVRQRAGAALAALDVV